MNIPVDFIPDQQHALNRAKQFATANDLSLYRYAPGTKTLDSQKLDESMRSARAQEELDAQRLAEERRQADLGSKYNYSKLAADTSLGNASLAENIRSNKAQELANAMKLSSAMDTTAAKSAKNESSSYKDHALLVMQNNFLNAKSKGLTQYNFASYVDYMKAKGAWDLMNDADKAAVLKAAQSLSTSLSGS